MAKQNIFDISIRKIKELAFLWMKILHTEKIWNSVYELLNYYNFFSPNLAKYKSKDVPISYTP